MSKRKVAEFFNSYADDFNAIYGNKNSFLNNIINNIFRKSMKLRYLKTMEGCESLETKSIIDIGCGPGHYIIALAMKGADFILGIDAAKGMIDLAKQKAKIAGVEDRCGFVVDDFLKYKLKDKYDYSIVMGFMDYIESPKEIIEKVLSVTKSKAFFSFPRKRGFLAWQRKNRYKKKCDLFMYNQEQLFNLFAGMEYKKIEVQKIGRDFFVTIYMK